MDQKYEIILASGSPRRRELLTQAGLCFTVKTADVDETPTETEPAKVVEELSRRKAEAVAKLLRSAVQGQEENSPGALDIDEGKKTRPQLIVAADTIVALDGEILGKPKDTGDAVRMLRELSGRTHEVFTGVTLLSGSWIRTFSVCTRVFFYPLTDVEILDYVATGEPMDKAGAYGIQGLGARLVEKIEGDYNNVVGFPLAAFLRILAETGDLPI